MTRDAQTALLKATTLSLTVSLLLGLAWPHDPSDRLRRELRKIASAPDDALLWKLYDAHLMKRGYRRPAFEGSNYALGHDCMLLPTTTEESHWEFAVTSDSDPDPSAQEPPDVHQVIEVPKDERFVLFVTDRRISETLPEGDDLDEAVVVVGLDRETLALTDLGRRFFTILKAPARPHDDPSLLRIELSGIAEAWNDHLLWILYDAHLKKLGFRRPRFKSTNYQFGHGCILFPTTVEDTHWEFVVMPESDMLMTDNEWRDALEITEVPKHEPFVLFVTDRKFSTTPPEGDDLDDAVVVFGLDRDTLLAAYLEIGRVTALKAPWLQS